jgi:phosphate transport system substrate-binding protein
MCIAGCSRKEEPNTTHGKLFMLVSESHVPLLKQEAAEFMAEYDKTDVQIAGTTTRGAIVALLNDSVHCICVDRQLNTEERKVAQDAGISIASVRIGRDAIVLIVNDHNPLKSISVKSLENVLDGSVTSWKKVPGTKLSGQLELVMTGRNSGIYEMLQQRFFKLTKELALAKIGESERQIARYVAASERAIGVVSLAAVVDRPRGIHLLAVESTDTTGRPLSIAPSQENVYDELYPLHYSLYLYISEQKLGIGSGFSTFVMTLPGQKIIQDYGLAPEIVPSRIIQLKSE